MQMEKGVPGQSDATERERYQPPCVVYEAELEVRAGSPLSIDLFDDVLGE